MKGVLHIIDVVVEPEYRVLINSESFIYLVRFLPKVKHYGTYEHHTVFVQMLISLDRAPTGF